MSATHLEELMTFGESIERNMSKLVAKGIDETELIAELCRLIQYKCLHTSEPDVTYRLLLNFMESSWQSSKSSLSLVNAIISNESN